uniref:Conjugal transfer protein traC n=2 Tax=Staphylococcus TaxID=1279 RepID=A0A0C5BK67_STAAU|nr:conjugal transfer protein traC [Staphylococcus aureus]AKL80231.1 putative membrane protein TrsC [Staphylococcus xylosus]
MDYMSVEQQVKDIMLDMLGEEKKVKENIIPRNVDASYKIFLNLNGKELAIVFIPFLLFLVIAFSVTFLMGLLNLVTGFMVFIVGLIFGLTIYGLLTIRPISTKENIRMIDILKQSQQFTKRQKVYFYKSKERLGDDDV